VLDIGLAVEHEGHTRLLIPIATANINPKIRIVQGNLAGMRRILGLLLWKIQECSYPTAGIRFLIAIGMVAPERADPMAMYPIARPRFFLNQ
jgi:hypothetical protein